MFTREDRHDLRLIARRYHAAEILSEIADTKDAMLRETLDSEMRGIYATQAAALRKVAEELARPPLFSKIAGGRS
jgi:hypothetical protein